jgi:hypothetical protein
LIFMYVFVAVDLHYKKRTITRDKARIGCS